MYSWKSIYIHQGRRSKASRACGCRAAAINQTWQALGSLSVTRRTLQSRLSIYTYIYTHIYASANIRARSTAAPRTTYLNTSPITLPIAGHRPSGMRLSQFSDRGRLCYLSGRAGFSVGSTLCIRVVNTEGIKRCCFHGDLSWIERAVTCVDKWADRFWFSLCNCQNVYIEFHEVIENYHSWDEWLSFSVLTMTGKSSQYYRTIFIG